MRILVATRGAKRSDRALCQAAELASALGASLTLLTVSRDETGRSEAAAVQARAAEMLDRIMGSVALELCLRIGQPAEEILKELAAGRYALVVLGERDHPSALSRLVLGSAAERVIAFAPCPVVVVKGLAAPPRRILICDSGVEESPLVRLLTERIPELLRQAERLSVLHVMSQMSAGPSVEGRDLAEDAAGLMAREAPEGRLLARDASGLSELGLAPTLLLRRGLVVDEILAEAQQGGHDLVVLGAHRGGEGWQRLLLGDLMREALRRLERPVLIIGPAPD